MMKREWLDLTYNDLKSLRYNSESDWRDIADNLLPYAPRWVTSDHNKTSNKRPRQIIDATGTMAAETASAGMMSGITNPARPWFALRTPNQWLNASKGVKVWLDDIRLLMEEVFVKSNLYTVLPSIYLDLVVFGASAFALLEDDDKIIRCYHFPIGSYWLGQDARGVVNMCFRDYQASASQLVREFGIDNVSDEVKGAYANKNHSTYYDIRHAIVPNDDYDDGKLQSKYKKYASCYYEVAHRDKYLRESGFDSFPVMAPRWRLTGEDTWGFGQGLIAIGDVRMLQLQQKKKLNALEKMINPPMVVSGHLRNGQASLLPGDITFIDGSQGQSGFTPAYQINPNIQQMDASIQETQHRIKQFFYEDMFLLISNDDRSNITAFEISQRMQEKLMRLGPVLERLNDELLDPLISRTFDILAGRGMIPPPPEELEGQELVIEYTSIMAQAQKMQSVTTIEQSVQFVANLTALDPNARHKVDISKTIDEYFNALGTPPRMTRSDDEVAAIMAQEQQMAAMQNMAALANSAAQTTKTLADAQTSEPSALQVLTQAASQNAIGA